MDRCNKEAVKTKMDSGTSHVEPAPCTSGSGSARCLSAITTTVAAIATTVAAMATTVAAMATTVAALGVNPEGTAGMVCFAEPVTQGCLSPARIAREAGMHLGVDGQQKRPTMRRLPPPHASRHRSTAREARARTPLQPSPRPPRSTAAAHSPALRACT
eukprot:363998-Chlamydomonas_euryale.AAC.2